DARIGRLPPNSLQELERALERRERRTQLVTGEGDELLLELAQATVGHVPDDDYAAHHATLTNRSAARFKPSPRAVGGRDGKRLCKRFTARCEAGRRGTRGTA